MTDYEKYPDENIQRKPKHTARILLALVITFFIVGLIIGIGALIVSNNDELYDKFASRFDTVLNIDKNNTDDTTEEPSNGYTFEKAAENELELDESNNSVEDISSYTAIVDTITGEDDNNEYSFNPTVSGEYGFNIFNYPSNAEFEINVTDDQNDIIFTTYDNDYTVKLEENKTYHISVNFCYGKGKYRMTIGRPHEIIDITQYDYITDEIYYPHQVNTYLFTASESGEYTFDISTNSDVDCDMKIYDEYGHDIASGYHNSCSTYLESGMQYRITATEFDNFGSYKLCVYH